MVGVFGSFARGEGKEGSDIDIFVEFEESYKTFDNFIELKYFLEDLFARNVDLVTVGSLNPQFKRRHSPGSSICILYLEDILASANKILEFVGNSSIENLLKDRLRIDAICA